MSTIVHWDKIGRLQVRYARQGPCRGRISEMLDGFIWEIEKTNANGLAPGMILKQGKEKKLTTAKRKATAGLAKCVVSYGGLLGAKKRPKKRSK